MPTGVCAQAAHIPVYLGRMAYVMASIIDACDWHAGDMVVVNDPYLGGHLPDVTVIALTYLLRAGGLDEDFMAMLKSTIGEGDFVAQISANRMGVQRLAALLKRLGVVRYRSAVE